MATKVERGLNYKVIKDREEFIENSILVRRMVKEYVDRAGDQFNVDQIMNLLSVLVGQKTLFICLVIDGDEAVGLLTAHAVDVSETKSGAMVHIGTVMAGVPKEQSNRIINGAFDKLYAWAKDNGMPSVFAQTKRNEEAFDRILLSRGWTRMTTVYEREIEDGRREEGSIESRNGGSKPSDVPDQPSDGGRERKPVPVTADRPTGGGPTQPVDAGAVGQPS